ncbi:MAG: putative selenate reductase subunit YgfK [Gammaproteobacteria bacterium]|nr:putative selenate reductase subunit YgfK [Gammaproteobacteria bacterium]
MSELFRAIATEQLVAWIGRELDDRGSIFGIPRRYFFVPATDAPYRTRIFGQRLDTPIGPAAGPHSQMAQNIVAAWLCGARYIELKTVQTLDVLDVSKPCIDMEDEGYNVEWSQELKVYESFDEYLRAWVLVHALHDMLGFSGEAPGVVFNMSVGYDFAGIQQPNVQWFLDQMHDCSEYKQSVVDEVAKFYPAVRDLEIPDCISDNVTLSTMHGCPPGEIERISSYLLRERGLHTLVKLNPTLLGPQRVRQILNQELNYRDITVPDLAFEHDLDYADAVPMLTRLRTCATECGLEFGVKLTNTLEVENARPVFDASQDMSYLSGRPLHAISVNLAHTLAEEFDGSLPMSFSAGANCFNVASLLSAGMRTVTVCSDLLKTGGYLRLLDYFESLEAAFAAAGASDIDNFIVELAGEGMDLNSAARANLRRYAARVSGDADYKKDAFAESHTKAARELGLFDCISAPCVDECPLHQKVPQYMNAVRDGNLALAGRIVHEDNPMPSVLGRICDHECERACVRNHLDEPLAIRDIKRFITDHARAPEDGPVAPATGVKVAIIGAGPGGMAAALELARGGAGVEIFEQQAYAGGMVGGVVPEYRLPRTVFDRDFRPLADLGVKIHYKQRAGVDFRLADLREAGFDAVVITVGAQLGKRLGLEGEDCQGVFDALEFLRRSKAKEPVDIGRRIGVIGAGDTAMDCARTACRYPGTEVKLIYRRSIEQMPADREEIEQLLQEGAEVVEFAKPERLVVRDGRLRALTCRRTAYAGDRDASGRKIPHEVPDSDFDVPLDAIILAISQHALLDFFDEQAIDVNERGFIRVNPDSFESSIPGIYAGGDAVNDGPASIVKAAAAGKAIARRILGHRAPSRGETILPQDVAGLLRHRSHRRRRIAAPVTPTESRDRDTEVMRTYVEEEARSEATRCLDCHTFCSLCVGVCPNLALQTYRSDEPGRQAFQVAVIADLCNECGNCTTFCPTSGRPYRDKPRLYLNRQDFDEQRDNAFMIFHENGGWSMDGRFAGNTHHIDLQGDGASDAHALAMYTLLRGMRQSAAFLPTAMADAVAEKSNRPLPEYEA